MSDHFSPWLTEQGHAPYAWSVLGAVAHATSRVGLMTYVTCPTIRYHPAVVAQKAATVQLLSEGRFTLGLGSGENLNEHVVGAGWPGVETRQEMLAEAVEIIRQLHTGDLVTYRGEHFDVDSARIWDAARAAGRDRAGRRRRPGDRALRAAGRPPRRGRAERRLRHLVERASPGRRGSASSARADRADPDLLGPATRTPRSSGRTSSSGGSPGGWKVNADLPTPAGFSGATQFVRPEDVAESIPCGPDLDRIVESVSAFWEAGFTDIALVQIGDESQEEFLREAAGPLLEKLRAASS